MSKFGNLVGYQPDDSTPEVVEFGEWLPDLMSLASPGSGEILNVIPVEGAYSYFPRLMSNEDLVLPATCKGAANIPTVPGDAKLYAGTRAGLYVRNGLTFTSVYTAPVTLNDDLLWQFIPFGDYVVALHHQIKPQFTTTTTFAPFAEVGGSPPRALCGARVGDFLVLGNLHETQEAGHFPRRVRWGGFNRIDAPWITDEATQADFQDLPAEGGEVMAIAGREFGTVFQERLISRMTYEGLPNVFRFESVEDSPGVLSTHSVVDVGAKIFFLSEEGFFMWNGVSATPIGNNKVNRYFFNKLNYGQRRRVVGSYDVRTGCVMWAFPVTGESTLTEIMIYSTRENRWSHAETEVEHIFPSSGLPVSLDDLTGNLDTDYSVSFDDTSYQRGREVLAGFNNEHAYGTFTGDSLAALLETSDSSGPSGKRFFVNAARPIIDIAEPIATLKVGRRDQFIGGNIIYTDHIRQEANGEFSVIADARYMRFRVEIPECAPWRHAVGVEVFRKSGGRF